MYIPRITEEEELVAVTDSVAERTEFDEALYKEYEVLTLVNAVNTLLVNAVNMVGVTSVSVSEELLSSSEEEEVDSEEVVVSVAVDVSVEVVSVSVIVVDLL